MMLLGKKALVTGASRGIGRGIACALASQGAAVAINYRCDREAAEETAAEIIRDGGVAHCFQADVSVEPEARRLTAEAGDRLGGLDILVNNVGAFFFAPLDNTSFDDWDRVLKSNLFSCFYLCKAALPVLRGHGSAIVNLGLSPLDRIRGAPNVGAYSVAKAGVLVLTRTLAVEEASHGVRINCVSPGLIDNGHLPGEQKQWMEARVPMGRLGTIDEVAQAVVFLVSDSASYISGANVSVSGGWDWEDRPTAYDGLFDSDFKNGILPEDSFERGLK
jgi:NAD(P)-dependent dehydrogenase (short-subunit alcohol dehydrogenase family)